MNPILIVDDNEQIRQILAQYIKSEGWSYICAASGEEALALFDARFGASFPLRSVGLSCSMLSPDDAPVQLDFTGDEDRRMRREQLERSIDDLRRRYGHQIVRRGVVLLDQGYSAINPVEDHTIHPVPFYAG